jgi:hypothetical protein
MVSCFFALTCLGVERKISGERYLYLRRFDNVSGLWMYAV